MYQMDALHTGRSPYSGPRQLTVLRSIDLISPSLRPQDQASITTPDIQSSTAVGRFHGTPALSRDGSTIYVAYAVGAGAAQKVVLYALKAPSSGQDAQVVWQTDLGPGGAQNSPTAKENSFAALSTAKLNSY